MALKKSILYIYGVKEERKEENIVVKPAQCCPLLANARTSMLAGCRCTKTLSSSYLLSHVFVWQSCARSTRPRTVGATTGRTQKKPTVDDVVLFREMTQRNTTLEVRQRSPSFCRVPPAAKKLALASSSKLMPRVGFHSKHQGYSNTGFLLPRLGALKWESHGLDYRGTIAR